MKHRNRLTNRITLELAPPVAGGRVLQRLYRHSWEPISTPQLLQLPSKTESPSSCRPPASPMIQIHGGTSKLHANISMPIRPVKAKLLLTHRWAKNALQYPELLIRRMED